MPYQIIVKTVSGKILTFNNVDNYEILPGELIKFIDTYTQETRIFHATNVEIKEVDQ